MEQASGAGRRRHDKEPMRQVLAECTEPGASVARVAMAHGLNANLVHKWRRLAVRQSGGGAQSRNEVFVPVTVAPAAEPALADIRIELRRGPVAISVSWPMAGASDCAAWVREIRNRLAVALHGRRRSILLSPAMGKEFLDPIVRMGR